jgi:hypothetical protein
MGLNFGLASASSQIFLVFSMTQSKQKPVAYPEAVFLVSLRMSSFPARHELQVEITMKLVPSYNRARIQLVSSLTKNTASGEVLWGSSLSAYC